MTENTTYICDYCGKVFDDSDECYWHEWAHKFELLKNGIKFMREENGVFVELPLTFESADQCTIIYCDGTDEVWDTIDVVFDYIGHSCIAKDIRADGHFFVYDDDIDDWFCLEKKMNYLVELSNKINQVIKGE